MRTRLCIDRRSVEAQAWETAMPLAAFPHPCKEPSMTVQEAVRTTNATSSVSEDALQSFAAQLRGPLIHPGDAEYDTPRRVHNGMIDRHHALIASCPNV